MANPFIAQITMFGGNFAPRTWAFCDGQLLAISQNSALFSLLGTTYGGDGRTTFALPDMRGRVSIHPGHGPGLSNYRLGERGGVEYVTLNQTQIPSHAHMISNLEGTTATTISAQADLNVSTVPADEEDPSDSAYLAVASNGTDNFNIYTETAPDEKLALGSVTITGTGNGRTQSNGSTLASGGNLSHTNIQPFLCVNYIIAMQGIFPSRS